MLNRNRLLTSSKRALIAQSAFLVLAIGCLVGCSRHESAVATSYKSDRTETMSTMGSDGIRKGLVAGKEGESNRKLPQELYAKLPAVDPNRKIIYTARVSVKVEDFGPLPEQVNRLVEQFGGYVSATNVDRMQGTRRSGSWTIRVPVDRYREFLSSVSGLGVPESMTEDAQEVTEEFLDLEARITSSRKLEEQISKLLEKDSSKIEDLIAVERELSRVRLEIERMEGRIRYLQNQVGMSTVYLNVSEEKTFVPSEQPVLSRRIQTEWSEAIGRNQRRFENTVLFLVANAFIIVGWIAALSIVYIVLRRWSKKSRRANLDSPTST